MEESSFLIYSLMYLRKLSTVSQVVVSGLRKSDFHEGGVRDRVRMSRIQIYGR